MRTRNGLLALSLLLISCTADSPVEVVSTSELTTRALSPQSLTAGSVYDYIHYVNNDFGGVRYEFNGDSRTLSIELYGTSGSGTYSEVVPDAQLEDVLNFLGSFERAVKLSHDARTLTRPCVSGSGPNCDEYQPMRATPFGGDDATGAIRLGRNITSAIGDPYVCGPMYFSILASRQNTLSISDRVANAASTGSGAIGSIISWRAEAEQTAADLAYGSEQWSAADCQGPVGTYVSVGNPFVVGTTDWGFVKKEVCEGYEIYVPLFSGTGNFLGNKEVHICRWVPRFRNE